MVNRYQQQLSLTSVGESGQKKLSAAKVCIVGCGGLGCIVAPYLAGAGVGEILLIDFDEISLGNLHRQVFYTEKSIGKLKTEVLKQNLQELNSDILVSVKSLALTSENINSTMGSPSLIIDCTDNLTAKYLLNDYAVSHHIPLIYGGLSQHDGQVSFFKNRTIDDCQLRDIFPEPSTAISNCSEQGVFNTLAGIIGLYQASEAIKYLVGQEVSLVNKLLIFDVLTMNQLVINLRKANNRKSLPSTKFQAVASQKLIMHLREGRMVISLIPNHIENDRLENVEAMHITEALQYDWSRDSQDVVFYCETGKNASLVTEELKHQYPNRKFTAIKNDR